MTGTPTDDTPRNDNPIPMRTLSQAACGNRTLHARISVWYVQQTAFRSDAESSSERNATMRSCRIHPVTIYLLYGCSVRSLKGLIAAQRKL